MPKGKSHKDMNSSNHNHESNSSPFISKNVLLFNSPQKSVNENEKEEDERNIKEEQDGNKKTLFDIDNSFTEENSDNLVTSNIQRQLTRFQILLKIFKTTTGKDKIAKLIKYFLELFALTLSKYSPYKFLQTKKTGLDLMNFPRLSFDPAEAIFKSQLVKLNKSNTVFFGSEGFVTFLANAAKQMAFFRHSLRFGWTYFNSIELYKQISAKKDLTKNFFQFNESDFLLILELYYNVVDDLLYLHKLKIWNNASLKNELDKHDARSWYYQIIYSLKTKYVEYKELNDFILKKEIKRDMLLENKDNLINKYDDAAFLHELDQLYKELDLVKLDLYRLGCDFAADSIDVFNLRVPKGSYAFFSFISGILGFKKLWLSNKYEQH
ncbi:hypothetical protein HANVADRAFT_6447 [Hanseniaspora valbyensis NRRL Y-1626]|uniref:Uncharacterized protein n=1 Tax=Hanseniaspora valbyensis NRRL Y-1626 TaxID=766949 RepID=A0A1B7TEM9_9ASCO|nr:hypothetical protein HANVADRAFT_6447 [Hanseniaspora valbyensis NRRL Y-1626]